MVECRKYSGGTIVLPKERLRLRPAVYGLVLHEGKVLLVRVRSDGTFYLPGGGLEVGERLAEGLRREVREETGIEVAVGEMVGFKEDFFYYDPLDLAFHSLLFFYLCQPLTFELAANEMIEDDEAVDPHWRPVAGLRPEDFFNHGENIVELLRQYRADRS
jgi:8-oxo-dGTP pyrophosphatase MutT (NUDIX family)